MHVVGVLLCRSHFGSSNLLQSFGPHAHFSRRSISHHNAELAGNSSLPTDLHGAGNVRDVSGFVARNLATPLLYSVNIFSGF